MPTEAKRAAVAELKEELSNSKATIVADYRGLTVSNISAVRRALRSEGISYRVVKNRLAKIAAQEAGRGELSELLEGPTALAMGGGDEVTLARTFLEAIRPYKSVVVRGGVIGSQRLDASSVTRLASLPSREILLAQLAGGMASPLAKMASLFAAPIRNLGYALTQLHQNRGQETDATEAESKAAEAPEAEATAEAPAAEAEATAEAPAAEATPEAPEAEATAEAPAAEATAEAPAAEATAEAPAAEATAEAPAAEATADAPEAEATAEATPEAPEAEAPAEAPEAQAPAEAPEPDSSPAEVAEADAETDKN
jgi:large subunit ribosomal protein L10